MCYNLFDREILVTDGVKDFTSSVWTAISQESEEYRLPQLLQQWRLVRV